MTNKVLIFDTTLRDGEQSPGISLNFREKLEIAEQLSRLGVDIIEAGFPITSPGDFQAVETIAKKIRGSTVCALARAVKSDIDCAWQAIKEAEKPRIHTFIATSDIHIERKLKKTKDEVLKMTEEAVKRAKKYTPDVEFSPEDATRSEFEFLCKVLEVAIGCGATTINIPDTVGYALPQEFGNLIKRLVKRFPVLGNEITLSVHCHNDLGLAVANSIEAVINGANQVECTINGLGERAGNAALEEIVMILDTRYRTIGKKTGIKTEEIVRTSRRVSALTGYPVQPNKAIVGANAFSHSSGIHTDGMLKDRTTYEIIDPKKIGLSESKLILGKTSGRHGLRQRLIELGYKLSSEELDAVFQAFKKLADRKSQVTDEDLEALVFDKLYTRGGKYRLVEFEIKSGTNVNPQARVVLQENGEVVEAIAGGDGPVDAVYNAIDRLIGLETKLVNFSITALTGEKEAVGESNIRLEIKGQKVMGKGVSTDIVEAAALAYINAINRYLMKQEIT